MILNLQQTRHWLGRQLGRIGPVSEKTWRVLRAQGIPVGNIGDSEFCSTEALEKWLEEMAATPRNRVDPEPERGKRGPGRPRIRQRVQSPAPETTT
jgi:hypothetical protein